MQTNTHKQIPRYWGHLIFNNLDLKPFEVSPSFPHINLGCFQCHLASKLVKKLGALLLYTPPFIASRVLSLRHLKVCRIGQES